MKRFTGRKILGIFIFLAVAAGAAAVVMLLWNAIIPGLTGWGLLGYWQALGLMALCRLLFGGIGKGFHGKMAHAHHKFHGGCGEGYPYGKEAMEMHRRFHEKLHGMSRKERRDYIRRKMAGMEEEHLGSRDGSETGSESKTE